MTRNALLTLLLALVTTSTASAREPYIGEIMYTAATFCPRGWAEADGSPLNISSHSTLFSLMGTTYGGDGQTTFHLPDLRGRVPVHHGQGSGLSARTQGQKGGAETVTLEAEHLPAVPVAVVIKGDEVTDTGDSTAAEEGAIGRTENASIGGNQAHNNLPPFLVLRACIALEGVLPSRS